MGVNWYNEIDPYAAQWLRNLIQKQLIPPGTVDERPIQDVKPADLAPFTQCHFFAGIGGWPLALATAGWPTDRPVWTGSCPCQPFSAAGKGGGFADERHLWPFWFHLIGVCRPSTVFGEQVARASLWLDLVLADLESKDYAVGAAVLPAAGVGAPHIRERIWFVADADAPGRPDPSGIATAQTRADFRSAACLGSGAAFAHANGQSLERFAESRQECGFWEVEPAVGRVAHGVTGAMEQLRAYGNAIVPQVAAEFIKAYLEC
jgi:DNA (cytosine-5)-methyltransferase 1